MNDKYHLRRGEKAIEDPQEIQDLLKSQQIMTLALSDGENPYLVTVDYVFDATANACYFHSAAEGKKVDYLAAHPRVWGQVLEDLGYIAGECDHAYRSVQFSGEVQFVTDIAEKRHALICLIEKFEADPEPAKRRFISPKALENVLIGKIALHDMAITGKKMMPPGSPPNK